MQFCGVFKAARLYLLCTYVLVLYTAKTPLPCHPGKDQNISLFWTKTCALFRIYVVRMMSLYVQTMNCQLNNCVIAIVWSKTIWPLMF